MYLYSNNFGATSHIFPEKKLPCFQNKEKTFFVLKFCRAYQPFLRNPLAKARFVPPPLLFLPFLATCLIKQPREEEEGERENIYFPLCADPLPSPHTWVPRKKSWLREKNGKTIHVLGAKYFFEWKFPFFSFAFFLGGIKKERHPSKCKFPEQEEKGKGKSPNLLQHSTALSRFLFFFFFVWKVGKTIYFTFLFVFSAEEKKRPLRCTINSVQ